MTFTNRCVPFSTVSLFLLTIISATPAFAQIASSAKPLDPRLTAIHEVLDKTQSPGQVAISPDGTTVAWTLRGKSGSQIHLTELAAPSKDKIVGAGQDCSSTSPIWSPDGQSLAFAATCTAKGEKQGQAQIFVLSIKTDQAKQITHVTGSIAAPEWSLDGKKIGFLFVENATRSAGALDAMKPWDGVIGEDGVEVQRIGVVNVADGSFTQVTPEKLHVYEFQWSPDSKQLAFVAAPAPGENNWWVAQLYTEQVDGATGQPKSILDTTKVDGPLHGLQIAVPRWSPDGTQIAFIGGLMSDQGSTGGDVYLVSSKGGEPKNVTPGRTMTPAFIGWVGDDKIGISEHEGGGSHIALLDLATGRDIPEYSVSFPESIGSGQLAMSISVAASSNDVAFVRRSFERAPEVWAGPVTNLKQITHLNDGLKPAWGKGESVEWTNEGFKVQGWLLYPVDYDPAKKYPLIVSVHGGPSSAMGPSWGGGAASYSATGYFVFMPNPRGSYGQGEKFTQANIKDFGYGDLRDILAGMDVLEKRFPIDKNREGLTGWSYGGFMTMFGVTQTTRFRAAVAGAGISDWKSYYGENSIDQWMVPFFGKTVYDDPAVYAKSSAIEYIKNVKTPTLVVVGDRDGECPAPQSFEFWHALRAEGVKTQLVVYPNEGHGFRNPEHQRDLLERELRWFATEMPAM